MTTDITRSAVAAPARFITDFAKMLCADIDGNTADATAAKIITRVAPDEPADKPSSL